MQIDLDRLAKVLGRLGLSFAGERAAAAVKATEIVRNSGTTWEELLLRPLPPPARSRWWPPEPARRPAPRYDFRGAAADCLNSGANLTDWEADFLSSLGDFPYLSARQKAVLAWLCRRCGVEWAT